MYAKGMCKNCYLSVYHKQKKDAKSPSKGAKKAEQALSQEEAL
jgi:hypothetical protein